MFPVADPGFPVGRGARGGGGIYNVHSPILTLLFYLWCSLLINLVPQEILVMAPEVARGVPLQVYINV